MWIRILSAVILLAVFVAGFCAGSARSQSRSDDALRYSPRHGWSIENGLPQNSVHDLLQSRDGALWIATFGGLARFDGHEFEIFSVANTPELGSSFLTCLLEDSRGRLWIGSANGSLACRTGHSFRGYGPEHGLPKGEIWELGEMPDGTIVIACGAGLMAVKRGRVVPFVADPTSELADLQSLHVDADGTVWCASGKGLHRVQDGVIDRIEFEDGSEYRSAQFVERMPGLGLLVQAGSGLALVVDGRMQSLRHIGGPAILRVTSALQNPDGGLILATGAAMWIVRIENGTAYFTPNSNESVDVTAVLRDREDNLWIGHSTRGLLQLARTPTTPIDFEGLRMKRGNLAFAAESATEAWFASTEEPHVLLVDVEVQLVTRAEQLPRDARRVLGVLKSSDGGLWIHHDQGLRIIREDSVEDREISVPAYATPMLEDADGAIWIGGRGALVRIDGPDAEQFGTEAGFPAGFDITALAEGPEGTIWVGLTSGLARLVDGVVTTWTPAEGMPGGMVRAISPQTDGSLWLGTYGGGLARFKDGVFARVDSARGLYSDAISRIEPDDQGYLWINSNRGVFRVRRADLDDVADGRVEALACLALRTRESGGLGGVRLTSGKMVFATIEGAVIVDSKGMTAQPVPPGIEITRVVADGVEHSTNGDMRVPPGPRELVFRFAGLSLTEPEAVRYRYRLTGFDADWRDGGGEGGARYTNVPPGDYRFEVLARSYDGVWSPTSAGVDLTLEPYFHETLWFRLASLLLILCSIVLVFERRARAADARQRVLQREVDLRTIAEESLRRLTARLIRAQEAERRRVALELHDDLGQRLALLGVSLDMLATNPRARAADGVASELHGLSDSVKSIASDVHGMSHRLHSTKLDKLGLRSAVHSLCKEMSSRHEIRIDFQCADDGVEPPPEVALGLYRITQEALRNAIRHSEAEAIRVEIEADGSRIRLVVSDDGHGFDPAADERREGLGLQGMRERVRLVGGSLELATAPGAGTRIEAAIPLSNSSAPIEEPERDL